MAIALLWVGPIGSAYAQESAAPAQTTQLRQDVRLQAVPTGVRRYTLGQWSAVGVLGNNKTSEPAEATLVVYLEQETQQQFARRMWIPPLASRTSWLPILPPKSLARKSQSIMMTMLPIVGSDSGEVIQRRAGDELGSTLPLILDEQSVKTGASFRRTELVRFGVVEEDPDADSYEMMAKAREMITGSRVIIGFPDDFAPPHPAMWESLDHFIICGDRMADDSAGLAALRDWLFRGGRACIFLDRTSLSTVEAILGHASTIQIVDRVELTDFEIEDLVPSEHDVPNDKRRLEQPAQLVRVLAEGADVHCRVNGWPAAFWQRAGEGEILFIALSPNGWSPPAIQPGEEQAPYNTELPYRSHAALTSVAGRFYQPCHLTPIPETFLQPVLREQIGYHIPSRRVAAGLLGLNAAGLLLGGVWLARRKQLDRLALLLPLVAGLTTAAFLRIGIANSQSVPPSVARGQLVRFFPAIDQAHTSGLAALYQQDSEPLAMRSGTGGLIMPGSPPPEGKSYRLVWGEDNQGEWRNVPLSAGSVQFARFEQSLGLTEHVSATAQFTADGVVGRVPAALLATGDHALIASVPAPPAAVKFSADGQFVVRPQDVLGTGQFLADTVLTDESRRRQEFYRSLLVTREGSRFALRPTLFAWIKPPAHGVEVPAGRTEYQSALGAIPLDFQRTPPGTEFAVPATFVGIESVRGSKGVSLAYNDRNGAWATNSSRATNTRLRLQLPREVLPGDLTQAQVNLKLNAPSRALEVLAVIKSDQGEREEVVQRIANPSGVYQITLDRPEWLQLDSAGGMQLAVVITESAQEQSQNPLRKSSPEAESRDTQADNSAPQIAPPPAQPGAATAIPDSFTSWSIDYLRVDLRGKTRS